MLIEGQQNPTRGGEVRDLVLVASGDWQIE